METVVLIFFVKWKHLFLVCSDSNVIASSLANASAKFAKNWVTSFSINQLTNRQTNLETKLKAWPP